MTDLKTSSAAPTKGAILIADPDKEGYLELRRIFADHGYRCVAVDSGIEALRLMEKQAFVAMLLAGDPERHCTMEVVNSIRRKRPRSEFPIFLVPEGCDDQFVVAALNNGVNETVNKSENPEITFAKINLVLGLVESRAELMKREERYALVNAGTNDGIWDWNLTNNEVYYSTRWLEILGIPKTDAGSPEIWMDRIHADDRERTDADLQKHLEGKSPNFQSEMRLRHEDGSWRWTLCRGMAIAKDGQKPTRIVGSMIDITLGKLSDPLTGLPNFIMLAEQLNRCFDRVRRQPQFAFALLYVDLDNFKLINDSLGHVCGDVLLTKIAKRLTHALREGDSTICRIGGDEFAILVEGFDSPDAPVRVADRIIESIAKPLTIESGRQVYPSVSVGISFSADGYGNTDEMLQAADTAMYRAKDDGKCCYRIFDPVMRESANKRLTIENELRHAIAREEISLHYQPIVNMITSRIVGFEALARWNHKTLGNISPADFIPIAEDTGMILDIGRQVLRDACRQMAHWQKNDARYSDLQMSVNLASRQLCSSHLVDEVMGILQETGLSSSNLRLEVTESSIMHNPEFGAEVLCELKKEGVTVAIDDFGTGYSSLAYIHKLSPDVIKIDRSFVDRLTECKDKEKIVSAIIGLAEGLNLDIVAEGVETESQRMMLATMGCTLAQGYLFSRPLPASEIASFVEKSPAPTQSMPIGNSDSDIDAIFKAASAVPSPGSLA